MATWYKHTLRIEYSFIIHGCNESCFMLFSFAESIAILINSNDLFQNYVLLIQRLQKFTIEFDRGEENKIYNSVLSRDLGPR